MCRDFKMNNIPFQVTYFCSRSLQHLLQGNSPQCTFLLDFIIIHVFMIVDKLMTSDSQEILVYLFTKVVFFRNLVLRCTSLCLFDLFSRQFFRSYHALCCCYYQEFQLNSHWLGFIVCLVEFWIIILFKISYLATLPSVL